MRLLLDTHAFLWWIEGNQRLPARVRRAIQDERNTKFVSAASAWEITTKYRLGKLPEASELAPSVAGAIDGEGFEELPITVEDGARAGALPELHRDPFDRILIAQAILNDLTLVSGEGLFDRYGVQRLW
ncbi:MAG: type II toxin-antitoxin system VapC family toxin [Chloroflexi bacterium]|nr:type II toxin-antitoxin system VapC family toxin [Chloroflexota bacterium]MCY3602691.1 type II toxin-antitoxin system VapC family toxin [Chloroflexota bacterium]